MPKLAWKVGLTKHVSRLIYRRDPKVLKTKRHLQRVSSWLAALSEYVANKAEEAKPRPQSHETRAMSRIKTSLDIYPDLTLKDLMKIAGVAYETARKYRALYRETNNLPPLKQGRPKKEVKWESSTAQSESGQDS